MTVIEIVDRERARLRALDVITGWQTPEEFRAFILAQIKSPGTTDDLKQALEDHLLLVARKRRRSGPPPATA